MSRRVRNAFRYERYEKIYDASNSHDDKVFIIERGYYLVEGSYVQHISGML